MANLGKMSAQYVSVISYQLAVLYIMYLEPISKDRKLDILIEKYVNRNRN